MTTPHERSELVRWLSNLLQLVGRIEMGWNRKASIEQQYASQIQPDKKRWTWKMGTLIGFGVALIVSLIFDSTFFSFVLGIAAGIASVMSYNNKVVTKKNAEIHKLNDAVWQRCNAELKPINDDLDQAGAVFAEQFANHFPGDYAYSDAVEFCYKVIQNHRADSVGAAINLYEQVLHQQRLEETQSAMLAEQTRLRRQQAVGMVVNTVMQGATISAIRSEGAANRAAGAASASMFRDEIRKLR